MADGRVLVGNFHGHAFDKAAEAGYSDADIDNPELGFSDARGTGFELAGGAFMLDGASSRY